MIELLWLPIGFFAAMLIWRASTLDDTPRPRCPTPRAIAVSLACSVAGPLLLLGAVGVWLGVGFVWLMERPKTDSWWTRPLWAPDPDDARDEAFDRAQDERDFPSSADDEY